MSGSQVGGSQKARERLSTCRDGYRPVNIRASKLVQIVTHDKRLCSNQGSL
jgi:hypothetical protein